MSYDVKQTRRLLEAARAKVAGYAAEIGVRLADDFEPLIERDWAEWIGQARAGQERNRLSWLGVISPRDLAHLMAAGIWRKAPR